MIHRCAEKLVDRLSIHFPMSEEERPIYTYGIEISLSTFLEIISVLVISLCLNHVCYALCYISVFFMLRLFCGGYHAETYAGCFLATNIIFIGIVVLTEVILHLNLKWFIILLIICSSIIIFIFSPVRNEKHPLSDKAYKRNQHLTQILCIAYSIPLFFGCLLELIPRIILFSAISYATVAVMMLIPIIQKKGGEKNEKSLD